MHCNDNGSEKEKTKEELEKENKDLRRELEEERRKPLQRPLTDFELSCGGEDP